tara:strand:+ start:1584 stop:2339 length:756 start_codon:yes stop_codon:yes gene_type:complete
MAKKATAASAAPKWEIKDRIYKLKSGKTPITATIQSRNMFWFDEEKGYEREVKYAVNQRSPFVDEFKGEARLAHIMFSDGVLTVPKEKQTLQKLLSLYHPLKNKKYIEIDDVKNAEDDLDILELEIEALSIAKDMSVDQAEAIMRGQLGSKVTKLTSKELKRDLLLFARNEPFLFLELANDENINIRNIGIKSVEQNIIALSNDQRTFKWAATGRKLMTVPFNENPYSALAAYFKTDDGIEVYQTVEKQLK